MADQPSGNASKPADLNPASTALASLAVGTAFFSLWFWLLPQWLGFRVETAGAARWRWLAAIPSVLGFAVALRCVWDFGWTGRGTPAPIPAPGRCRLLPLRAQSHVRRFRRWLDRPLDRLRSPQPHRHLDRRRRGPRRPSVRALLRRADAAQKVRRRLRRVSSQRTPLVAPCESVEQILNPRRSCGL